MPIYEFYCEAGHVEEYLLREADVFPQTCLREIAGKLAKKVCGKPLKRIISAPSAFPGAASWRKP
jgi:hypothetical protein